MYACRHTFAKRTLSGYYTGRPVTIEVLAGLMGNTPKVCWDHYAAWPISTTIHCGKRSGRKSPYRQQRKTSQLGDIENTHQGNRR